MPGSFTDKVLGCRIPHKKEVSLHAVRDSCVLGTFATMEHINADRTQRKR